MFFVAIKQDGHEIRSEQAARHGILACFELFVLRSFSHFASMGRTASMAITANSTPRPTRSALVSTVIPFPEHAAMKSRIRFSFILFAAMSVAASAASAHDPTLHRAARRKAGAENEFQQKIRQQEAEGPLCKLSIRLVDDKTGKQVPGVVRITRQDNGKALAIPELIKREENWYTMGDDAELTLPRVQVAVEALRGIETEVASVRVDLRGKAKANIELRLRRFYHAKSKGWRNGNTHLHLMKLTFAEADRYLRLVPQSDDLELVFLSHLRRIPDEQTYISNLIVENSLPGGDLARLSQTGVLFRPGEEHRHNFGRGAEGFGHVMLLDIAKLIRPVSIGPGIMRNGTDARPLQRGMREARRDGATVVWCHNQFGYEDIPNWMAGTLDAQNIFDGGNRGNYEGSFYRYLNIGLRTPFSTGTDWFIDDFSRVYVPLQGELTSREWLKQLRAGRSFITNGPLLEFSADGRRIGDTLKLDGKSVAVSGSAAARTDFGRIELIHNGRVIANAESQAHDGHFVADLEHDLRVAEPGWIALRTPLTERKNAFGNQLYSHTSPIYLEFAGKTVFHAEIAEEFLREMQSDLAKVKKQAVFADPAERNAVLNVYQNGIEVLRQRINAQP